MSSNYQIQDAPRDWRGILKQLGPGLIISANIVGSGELIVTTKLGAEVGFTLLWFIIIGCVIKVFLQLELGRHAIVKGKTTLQALNEVPGPKLMVSWLVWLWLIMFVATFFQLSGIVGGIAQVAGLAGSSLSDPALAAIITGSCAVLLFIGRYRLVEQFSTYMVASFTLFTIFAVFSLYWTDYGIGSAQLIEGFKFQLPDDFMVAFAAFGVIGVGAAELIYYPYWCLEKGYGTHVGPCDDSPEWEERAKGWIRVLRWDAWVSCVIYTGATVAFYLLGAAVLHGKGIAVENDNLMLNLSSIYSESFGVVGLWIFLLASFFVLYSTVFVSTASNGRLAVDLLTLCGAAHLKSGEQRIRMIKWACVALPALYFIFYLSVGKPVTLVTVGAVAQALMLPFLCYAALHYLYRDTRKSLRPGRLSITLLWVASALMALVGLFQFFREVRAFM